MAALQWRTVSSGTAPAFVRQPHGGRSSSRVTVRVQASIVNPHSILGVSPTADVKEVKRAYRKLALQYHPDVCKTEDGHQRFMTLTQAYEMLLGRAEGKTDPNHASASGWDFHDWYWNFRMQRSWEKQQRQAKAAAAAAAAAAEGRDPSEGDGCGSDPGCGRRPPPSGHAGYKQPEARANLRSQLAGLRHRAAVRANRSTTSAAAAAGPSPATWSAASGCSMDAEDVATTGAGGSTSGSRSASQAWSHSGDSSSGSRPASADASSSPSASSSLSSPSSGPLPSWSWSWDDTFDFDESELEAAAAAAAAAERPSEASTAPAGGVPAAGGDALGAALYHQYTHVYDTSSAAAATAAGAAAAASLPEQMALQDGHPGTVVVANHAVPFSFPGSAAAQTAGAAASHLRSHSHSHQPHRRPQSQQSVQDVAMTTTTTAEAANYHHHHHHSQQQQQQQAYTAEPEPESPFSNPFERGPNGYQQQQQQARRRGFNADSATREAVSHQLTGLRRKAALKATHWSTAGADGGSSD